MKKRFASSEAAMARSFWCFRGVLLVVALLVFIGQAIAADNVWTWLGPYSFYAADDLAVDPSNPQTVYAGSSGLWKSTDGGAAWAYLNQEGLPGGSTSALAVRVDPTNFQTVYAGGGYGLYRSTDGGISWALVRGAEDQSYIFDLEIDPSNPRTLYASTMKGLFKTTDGGTTWIKTHPTERGDNVETLAIVPSSPQTLYFAVGNSAGKTDGGLFKTTDGGATWNPLRVAAPFINSVEVDPSNSQTVYVVADSIFKSTDGGATWTASKPNPKSATRVVAVDPTNSQTLYAGAGGVYKSTDGGATWTSLNLRPGLTVDEIAVSRSTPQSLYVGIQSNGVYKSADGGATWTQLKFSSSPASFLVSAPSSPRTLYASVGKLCRSGNGGATWVALSATGTCLAVDPSTPWTLYLGTSSGVRRSTDGGSTWMALSAGFPTTNRSITALAIDPSSPQTVYAGNGRNTQVGGEGVYKTTDGGASWQNAKSGLPSGHAVYALAIDPSRTQTVYAGFDSMGVYKTTDGGASWSDAGAGLPDDTSVRVITVAPFQTQTVYAATNKGVFKTTDGGATWTGPGTGIPANTVIRAVVVDPSRTQTVYAGAYSGVYRSVDGGAVWTGYNVGLTSRAVIALALDPAAQKLYANSNPGGVSVVSLSDEGSQQAQGVASVNNIAVVNAQVSLPDGRSPIGLGVSFARSAYGSWAPFSWKGTTDQNGKSTIRIAAQDDPMSGLAGASGYYRAFAKDAAGSTVGEWSSIPVRGGRSIGLLLPVGQQAAIIGPFFGTPIQGAGKPVIGQQPVTVLSGIEPLAPAVSFGTTDLETGGALGVPVLMAGTKDLFSGDLILTYDSTLLTFREGRIGETNLTVTRIKPGQVAFSFEGLVPKEQAGMTLWFDRRAGDALGSLRLTGLLYDQHILPIAEVEVETRLGGETPTHFALFQNYPNPFNPVTQIRYALPQTGQVRLTIYNALGQVVARLVDSRQEAGTYSVTWDARGMASGVYFSRLEVGTFRDIKRLVLLK